MTQYFELGRILKPQGIKGEVKIAAFTDSLERFSYLEFVYFKREGGYERAEIEKVRTDATHAYIKFSGVADRDMAEKLRGQYVYIDRQNAAPLPKGSYYISDLIGMAVHCGEKELGRLTDILQTGSKDVYVVKLNGGGTLMFPSVEGVIASRDVEAARMELNEEKLGEVAVYDI